MLYSYSDRCDAKISALGVGTWSMGGTNAYGLSYGDVADDTSIAAIHALVDGGVNLVDTAPVYGGDFASEYPERQPARQNRRASFDTSDGIRGVCRSHAKSHRPLCRRTRASV